MACGGEENWIKSFQDLSTIFMTANFRLYANGPVHVCVYGQTRNQHYKWQQDMFVSPSVLSTVVQHQKQQQHEENSSFTIVHWFGCPFPVSPVCRLLGHFPFVCPSIHRIRCFRAPKYIQQC